MVEHSQGRRVVAVGLDAGEIALIRRWIDDGHLPNMAAIFRDGLKCQTETGLASAAELPWTVFLSSCSPQKTGFWSPYRYSPDYKITHVGAYDYNEFGRFYDYCRGKKVIALDVPQARLSEAVDGIQIANWGSHSAQVPAGSLPEDMLDKVNGRYGSHPALHPVENDTVPVGEMNQDGKRLEQELIVGIERRTAMFIDLLKEQEWDLAMTVYGEPHSAGHCFWHLSQPDHPLYGVCHDPSDDPLLNVFKAQDAALGRIRAALPDDAALFFFSPHGMRANGKDGLSFLFLPELMFRYSFDGKAGMAAGEVGKELPPFAPQEYINWMRAAWTLRHDDNAARRFIRDHSRLRISQYFEKMFPPKDGGPEHPLNIDVMRFEPTTWYQPVWKDMKAFALHSFSDGYVRVNVAGREAAGKVAPADYDRVCDEITALLYDMKDARSGRGTVEQVIRTRKSAMEGDSREFHSDADLIVLWDASVVTDAVDTTNYGRIGPAPFFRSGVHTADGFFTLVGDGIEPGDLPNAKLVDMPATILDLLGVPMPNHFEGHSLANEALRHKPAA